MTAEAEDAYRGRIIGYMHKAMREAKVYTSWINPSERHEQAMTRFVEAVLATDNRAFRQDFSKLHRLIARYGIYNSLSQLAIKIGAPGVPDFYQGTELWDFSLVDPDNRRPVDYERRRRLLAELEGWCRQEGRGAVAARLIATDEDHVKLFATSTLLRFRGEHRDLFDAGGYRPLEPRGTRGEHLFAFARTSVSRHAIVAVPRLVASLTPEPDVPPVGERVWGDTALDLSGLPASVHYRDALTDRCLAVQHDGAPLLRAADVFAQFPVALLVSAD
jgi:(1->4)-alpha-D-glucan 1-alpha-D-glucosylmutase